MRRPFRAPPLKDRSGNVIPFQKQPRKSKSHRKSGKPTNWGAVAVLMLAAALIGFGASIRFGDYIFPQPDAVELGIPVAGPQDTLSATFTRCSGPVRHTCIVDGDTFWLDGEKYRIADINTPEISSPQCDNELAMGERATARLQALMNAGPFSLRIGAENTDRYGRKLRTVWRGDTSLGEILVNEGLAERWQGFRGSWC